VPLEEDRGIKVQILSRYPASASNGSSPSSFTSPDIEQLLCLGYLASFPSSDSDSASSSSSRWGCLSSSPSSSSATAIGVNTHERLYYIGDHLSSASFSSSSSSSPGLAVVLLDPLLHSSSSVSSYSFWWFTVSIASVFLILTLLVLRLQKHKSSLFSSIFTPSTPSSDARLEGERAEDRREGDIEE
jgi:hypothetical protein